MSTANQTLPTDLGLIAARLAAILDSQVPIDLAQVVGTPINTARFAPPDSEGSRALLLALARVSDTEAVVGERLKWLVARTKAQPPVRPSARLAKRF